MPGSVVRQTARRYATPPLKLWRSRSLHKITPQAPHTLQSDDVQGSKVKRTTKARKGRCAEPAEAYLGR